MDIILYIVNNHAKSFRIDGLNEQKATKTAKGILSYAS